MAESTSHDIKAVAHRLIDALPDDATWDDVMYRIYVRRCVDAGLQDAEQGNVLPVEEIRRRFGLTP